MRRMPLKPAPFRKGDAVVSTNGKQRGIVSSIDLRWEFLTVSPTCGCRPFGLKFTKAKKV